MTPHPYRTPAPRSVLDVERPMPPRSHWAWWACTCGVVLVGAAATIFVAGFALEGMATSSATLALLAVALEEIAGEGPSCPASRPPPPVWVVWVSGAAVPMPNVADRGPSDSTHVSRTYERLATEVGSWDRASAGDPESFLTDPGNLTPSRYFRGGPGLSRDLALPNLVGPHTESAGNRVDAATLLEVADRVPSARAPCEKESPPPP